jgi:lipoyl synthase
MSQNVRVLRTSRSDYCQCYALQRQLLAEIIEDRSRPATIILTEHHPVITLGRSSRREHIVADPRMLKSAGVTVVDTDRGGDVTYHGPGQIVVYPILPLERFGGKDLGRFLRALEEVVIRALAHWGLIGQRIKGLSGVWVDGSKVCALGVGFRRWVSFHGIALNHTTNMDHFDLIVPCGIRNRRPVSLQQLLGPKLPGREQVEQVLLEEFSAVFGAGAVDFVEESVSELPAAIEPLAQRGRVNSARPKKAPARRHPPWLVKRLPVGGQEQSRKVGALLDDLKLNTVCRSANCPNVGECFARGTATFLIMGPVCTRSCRFCSVDKQALTSALDSQEPARVAEAARRLGLEHVVVTSVTRDDLADGGASHFVATVQALRAACPQATIELLIPDLGGQRADLLTIMNSAPEVLNHNLETVPRLYSEVRPEADYHRSLEVLSEAKKMLPGVLTKSGLMVGLGERPQEVATVLQDLAGIGVGAVTIGQYLAPTQKHYPVAEYVRPEQFDDYAQLARQAGIKAVACGPWVRSSYGAARIMTEARKGETEEQCATR